MLVCVSDQMREGLEILLLYQSSWKCEGLCWLFFEWWLKMHELELYCVLVCFSV